MQRHQFVMVEAEKERVKARIGLFAPAGAGKTFTSLMLAGALGEKVGVIDTENNRSKLCAPAFRERFGRSFYVLPNGLPDTHPQTYIDAIHFFEDQGMDVIDIDSLSHAWAGKDGALNLADDAKVKYKGNTWAAWREVTPLHNDLVESILKSPCHIIATMRVKTAWETEKDEKTGKITLVKIGLQPVQRDGMEYEFDMVAELDMQHVMTVTKSRYPFLDGRIVRQPGPEVGEQIRAYAEDGIEPVAPLGVAAPSTETSNGPARSNGASPQVVQGTRSTQAPAKQAQPAAKAAGKPDLLAQPATESNRQKYHELAIAYLSQQHGMTTDEYSAFIEYRMGVTPEDAPIQAVHALADYCYGARNGKATAQQVLGDAVTAFRAAQLDNQADAAMGRDDSPVAEGPPPIAEGPPPAAASPAAPAAAEKAEATPDPVSLEPVPGQEISSVVQDAQRLGITTTRLFEFAKQARADRKATLAGIKRGEFEKLQSLLSGAQFTPNAGDIGPDQVPGMEEPPPPPDEDLSSAQDPHDPNLPF